MVVLLGGLVITQQYGIGRETSDAGNFTIRAKIVQSSPPRWRVSAAGRPPHAWQRIDYASAASSGLLARSACGSAMRIAAPRAPMPIELICLDADDTLWHNMRYFEAAESALAAMLEPFATVTAACGHFENVTARRLHRLTGLPAWIDSLG